MSMSSYYLGVPHEHVQLLVVSSAWAWAVITNELRMIVGSYYTWVTHENEQLLLISCAWALQVLPLTNASA